MAQWQQTVQQLCVTGTRAVEAGRRDSAYADGGMKRRRGAGIKQAFVK